jgi:SAM-dependent methyltransferase
VVSPVAQYYAEKLSAHGVTPRGVDWNSDESQQLRFTELLRVMEDERSEPTVLDYGCGYGALAQRLISSGGPISDKERFRYVGERFRYVGFDVCTPMIEQARANVRDPRCAFTDSEDDLPIADYTLASGIFNVRLDAADDDWQAHVVETLGRLAAHSSRGFAFNMLTRYADREKLRDYLYYADPAVYFRLCKERWSRNVALLHHYDLYEFTILVKLDSEPRALLHP